MRNIYDVIRQKETQIQDIQKEVEALRLAARILQDDEKAEEAPKVRMASAINPNPTPFKTDTEVVLSAPHRPFP
jgi:hypothetical protein